ncbi:MAG: transporter [Bacteroidetes bacterium]|nr:transporter [Bacteroidota bacterium]
MLFIFLINLFPVIAFSGPPYDTDDPEPVDFRHWEFYSASHITHDDEGWNATMMHFEINYGAAPDLQLHAIVPFAFNSPSGEKISYGLGDVELGAKYRIIRETKDVPMVGIFPLVELPTGNSSRGLGNGKAQIFLPVWVQKSFGKWTTYGGAGYMINFSENAKNNLFLGWQVQNQVAKNLNIGTELYYKSPQDENGKSEVRFNVGVIFDMNEHNHLLLSAGRSIQGPVKSQMYIGYQLTLGNN